MFKYVLRKELKICPKKLLFATTIIRRNITWNVKFQDFTFGFSITDKTQSPSVCNISIWGMSSKQLFLFLSTNHWTFSLEFHCLIYCCLSLVSTNIQHHVLCNNAMSTTSAKIVQVVSFVRIGLSFFGKCGIVHSYKRDMKNS